jgi:DNA gyrase/topoisomerase IV subunit B
MTDQELLRRHAAQLAEFFDTVQIFVSKHDSHSNLTYKYDAGVGNLLARMYQSETWLAEQEFEGDDENDD